MGILRVKSGVRFDRIDPAGFRLLGSLDRITREVPYDLTVTCGTNAHETGQHPKGRAYDVRSKTLTPDQKRYVLHAVLLDLALNADDVPVETSGGLATVKFFGQLEYVGQPREHLHFQLRQGRRFP